MKLTMVGVKKSYEINVVLVGYKIVRVIYMKRSLKSY